MTNNDQTTRAPGPMISFEPVTQSAHSVQTLYDLLSKRTHSISHQSLPPFEKHQAFVRTNPYKAWFFTLKDGTVIGSFYIQHNNSIGVNLIEYDVSYLDAILDFIRENFEPEPEVPSLVPPYFFINVAWSNQDLRALLEQDNRPPIQVTYKL